MVASVRNARLAHATALIADVDEETNPSLVLSAREVDLDVLQSVS